MLANTLNTNEIKDRAGVEVEFARISQGERKTEFAAIAETPSAPHRLNISHVEIGTGTDKRRRSLIRFDKTVSGQVDTTKSCTPAAYMVVDIPVGNLTSYDSVKDIIANLLSFCATTGAATTVLFDGTGNGASTAIGGSL